MKPSQIENKEERPLAPPRPPQTARPFARRAANIRIGVKPSGTFMDEARYQYRFAGFEEPHYTPIPDVFFDEVMCHLTEAELRVALYILRRTFGFKKRSDAISFNQFLKGITTRDSRRLDHGCGIAGRTNLTRALKGLEDKGIIVARRSTSVRGDAQTTVYELRFKDSGVVPERDYHRNDVVTQRDYPSDRAVPGRDYPGDRRSLPVVIERDLQETGQQKTANKTTAISKEEATTRLAEAIGVASQELGDARHTKANRTRATRMLAHLSDDFAAHIAALALSRVQGIVQRQGGVENPIAYYFKVLDDLGRQADRKPERPRSLAGRYEDRVQR